MPFNTAFCQVERQIRFGFRSLILKHTEPARGVSAILVFTEFSQICLLFFDRRCVFNNNMEGRKKYTQINAFCAVFLIYSCNYFSLALFDEFAYFANHPTSYFESFVIQKPFLYLNYE